MLSMSLNEEVLSSQPLCRNLSSFILGLLFEVCSAYFLPSCQLFGMAASRNCLNVIGLISGGKDSFFSLLHCIENHHRITAVANLYPPSLSSEKYRKNYAEGYTGISPATLKKNSSNLVPEDLNSFMYQTAGHTLIPLYADALGLPLYRQEIIGSARDSSKNYRVGNIRSLSLDIQSNEVDETESLVPLLKRVMAAHPEANAVCSGAILSTYQRTRIESVAIRLGLVPLSYLWQYPTLPQPSPSGLLDDMASVDFDVRIVKVASGGLDKDFLWCNLMEKFTRKRVEKALRRFGGSVLGEGGEYETVVIDGPPPLWKGRIEVDEAHMLGRRDQETDSAASLGFEEKSGRVIYKETEKCSDGPGKKLRKIGLWDVQFKSMLRDQLREKSKNTAVLSTENHGDIEETPSTHAWVPKTRRSALGSSLYFSNMTDPKAGSTASEQMLGIIEDLRINMEEMNLSPRNIVFTTILLRSLTADFAAVNNIYGRLFTKPNPPARVTIASCLPLGVNAMASFTIHLGDQQSREGLHVQSRSYWAPANIGPYSQAISVKQGSGSSLVYVAGQIPLVPATMEVLQVEGNKDEKVSESSNPLIEDISVFKQRALLSLQHLWRIGVEMNVGWWTGGIAFIAGQEDMQRRAMIAHQIWADVHQRRKWEENGEETEEEDFDVWDKKYGGNGDFTSAEAETRALPDFSKLSPDSQSSIPGFFAVQVDELPRGCDVEWQSLGVTRSEVSFETTVIEGADVTKCNMPSANKCIMYISIGRSGSSDIVDRLSTIMKSAQPSSRNATDSPTHGCFMTVYTAQPAKFADAEAQVVPCRAVWAPRGMELAAGVVAEFMI